VPYPGTELYEQVRNDPELGFTDDSMFPEGIEGPLSARQERVAVRRAYLKYYVRWSYVLSRLMAGEFRALAHQLRLFWAYVNA
jgi:hypothetical protein